MSALDRNPLAQAIRAHTQQVMARAHIPSAGPWTAKPDGSVVDADGQVVAIVMRAADLPAIAAAPDMLAALRLALDAMNHIGDVLNGMDATMPEDEARTTPAFDAVRAAIARAEEQA